MNKRKRKTVLLVIMVALILTAGFVVHSSRKLIVTRYEIEAGFSNSIRIVHLTDLHNAEFGKGNKKLIKKVLSESPDIIVMTGDMINEDEEDISIVISLIKELSEKTPIYYSMGNHEVVYSRIYSDLSIKLKDAGAKVLNYEYQDIQINGNDIRIGGYYGYYRTPHMNTNDLEVRKEMTQFCDDFEETDVFKLLLCHIPTTWLDWNRIDDFPINLVLSGHYHGGQIRIPFIGGVHAPYVGWFPKYTKGLFTGTRASCILSTGLGSSLSVPRINNPPEIVVIDLK